MNLSTKIFGTPFGSLLNRKFKIASDIYRRCLHKKPLPPEHCKETAEKLMKIKCKVALITGGVSGIGLATAALLLKKGARGVVLIGLDECTGKCAADCLNNNYGKNKAMFIQADVNCKGQIEDAFKETYDCFDRLDIVVNSAGVLCGYQWEKEVETNIIGTIRTTLLAYKYVSCDGRGEGGVLVNLAGLNALKPLPPAPTFAATQHAILGFSRSFGHRKHFKRSKLRVVTLCPGFTQTDFIRNVDDTSMTDEMGYHLRNTIECAKKQNAEACGQAVVHLVKYGCSGSVWVIEGSRLFLLDLPNPRCGQQLVAQFL